MKKTKLRFAHEADATRVVQLLLRAIAEAHSKDPTGKSYACFCDTCILLRAELPK